MSKIPQRHGVRTGGWSQSGNLKIGSGGLGGLVAQVSFWSPEDPRQRAASEYTISFNVDTLGLPAANRKVNPVAEVKFSTEGNTIKRRISVVNGSSISGVCEHVSVHVVDDTPNPAPPVPPGQEYVVSILITPGTRPARHVPPYLRGTAADVLVPAAGATTVPIPDDAGVHSVAVFAYPSAGGVIRADQQDFATVSLAQWDPANTEWVGLFPTATNIVITNLGAVAARVAVLFGVDG